MQKSVIEYLAQTVRKYPNKVAVHDEVAEITFAELWQNASLLANEIQKHVDVRQPIGVYIPKGC